MGQSITHLTAFAVATVLTLAPGQAAWAQCADNRVELRGDWGQAAFTVEIADDDSERGQGLMNRPSMPSGAGMLFIYDQPVRAAFWMQNTLIPLDMIFADKTGQVTRIHENAIPLDRTTIDGGNDVLYVLEINGGLSSALGLTEGSQLRHPRIQQDQALWPCDAK